MQKIVILFLGDADRTTLNYQGIEKELAKDYGEGRFLSSRDENQIREFLTNFNTNEHPLLVTVLAHGGMDCISAKMSETEWIRLSYVDLLTNIAACRTEQPVSLNLVAPCNTISVLPLLANYNIDEVWYTTCLSDSLHNGLTAAKQGFKSFSFMNNNDRFFCHRR
jgi:hypothetical protein